VGWWPGDATVKEPAFFSYAAPQPPGFSKAPVRPAAASYNTDLSQFFLRYDDVRSAASPRQALLDFLPEHLRGRGDPRQMESRGARAQRLSGVTQGDRCRARCGSIDDLTADHHAEVSAQKIAITLKCPQDVMAITAWRDRKMHVS
jgi:hypothetical protein